MEEVKEKQTAISIGSELILTALASEMEAERNRASLLALMERLQISLERGSHALLALDLAGIRQQTAEQAIMSGELKARLTRNRTSKAQARELEQKACCVFRAARLHLALLARLQHKLLVMANMLAGTSADYAPVLAGGRNLPLASSRNIAR
jgi:hypothetical protein